MGPHGSRSGRAVIPVLVVIALVVLISLSVRNWLRTQQEGESSLTVSGTVEARYTRIASLPGGRLLELHVEEGQLVREGELVAVTDSLDLPQRIAQSEAAIDEARAALALLEAGPTSEEVSAARHRAQAGQSIVDNLELGSRVEEIAAARNAVNIAEAQLADARDELARLQLLYENNVVEERRMVAAGSRVSALEESLAASREQLNLLEQGPREEEIEQARQNAAAARSEYERVLRGAREEELLAAMARVKSLEAGRDALLTNLQESSVHSPADGEVVLVPVTKGDLLNPGGVVCELLLPESLYIQTFIPEDRLAWISIGEQLQYQLDGASGSGTAVVSFISPTAEFTPRNLQTTQKRVEQVFRVKLLPDNPGNMRPGLICDIEIPAPEGSDGSDG